MNLATNYPHCPITPTPPLRRLPVNDELDILWQTPGHLSHHVAFEQGNQFVPVRRTEHENVNAERGGEVEDRRSWIFADREQGNDLDFILPALFEHGIHDVR